MRALNCLLPSNWLKAALAATFLWGFTHQVSAQVLQADGASAAAGQVEQASYRSSGSVYSREFGSPLRFSYHTEGYGTETGVVSLGTMKVFNLDGATWFLDGQGTMSDSFGGGFNAGIGYREMVNFNGSMDPDRILGASFWTDGQSTQADNFFTQLGFGLESLGESFDLRLSGYFPLDRTQTGDAKLVEFETPVFIEHGLFSGLERTITDTAYDVVDGEFAKRIGDLDAWAYLGGYHLGGAGDDGTGYRIGFRGYALPDLLLGLQVTDDNIYSTNVMFNMTWFVGRTHKGNANVGVLADRFREPVFRNDYIATTSQATDSGILELTNAANDQLFHILHVDSSAAAGGDGTIENPYSSLAEAEAAQADFSIVFMHSGSTFSDDITLADNVRLLGEGLDQFGNLVQHTVDTVELTTAITLPESSTGASGLNAPELTGIVTMGNDTEYNNATSTGATSAVVANGVNAVHLANLDINLPTGIGIDLTNTTGDVIVENSVTIDIDNAAATAMLIDGGADDMVNNAIINAADGQALTVQNRTGGTITYGGTVTASGGTGMLIENNTAATINFGDTVELTTGDNQAVTIQGNDVDTAISFADLIATSANANTFHMTDGGMLTINDINDTSTISNTGTGTAFFYDQTVAGDDNSATINVAADITNTTSGNAVSITDREANDVSFTGDIDHSGDDDAIVLTNNTGGTIAFDGLIESETTGTAGGVNATAGSADVTYTFDDLVITTVDGTGFNVTGEGTLEVTSTGMTSISTTSGRAINLDGLAANLTIGANGATFDTVNVSDGATNSVVVRNTDGTGLVTVGSGTAAGAGGTISTSGTGIVVDNADNFSALNMKIDNSGAAFAAGAGVEITNQNGGTTNFASLEVSTQDAHAVNVHDNTGGTNIFTDLVASTSGTGDVVNMDTNNGATTTFNDMELTASGTGNGFVATDQGTIAVTATATTGGTSVTTESGRAINLNNVTIDSTNVSIDKVQVNNGTTDSVSLVDLGGTGSVTLGADTTDPGTITTSGRGVLVDGGANNITVNMDVTTSGASEAFEVTDRTGGTVTMNGTITGTGVGGINLATNTGGTINLNDVITLDTAAQDAITITGNNGATINFGAGADVNLGATDGTGTTGSGVHLTGTNTNVTIAGNVSGGSGTSLDIEGNATAVVSGNVTNTAGRAFQYHNVTAGTVTVDGTITDNGGTGISVDNNSGGTLTVNGKATLNTGNNDALTISTNTGGTFTIDDVETTTVDGTGVNAVNNTGATINLGGMDITATGTGVGFNATGGGTLRADGTNTVSTQSGVGVNINGMGIAGAGVAFNEVNVNAGATSGITLTNTSGGPIRFGAPAATNVDGTGGTLNTAGNSIALAGVHDVTFNDMTTNNSGAGTNSVLVTHTTTSPANITFNNLEATTVAGTGDAVVVNDNGSGELDFTLTDSNIDSQLSNSIGFLLEAGNSAGQVDVRVIGNTITGGTSSALSANIDEGTGSIQYVLSDNVVSSSSADPAASFVVNANRTLNAVIGTADGSGTLLSNSFSNGTGVGLRMETVSGSSAINLDLRGNSASGGTFDYQIVETAGDFSVVEQDDTLVQQNQNSGTIDFGGGAAGDFADIMSVPQQPD